jgi:hypothetical protein
MVFEFCVWDWREWDGACEESKWRSQDWEINVKRIREDNVNWTALLCVGSSYAPTFQECPPHPLALTSVKHNLNLIISLNILMIMGLEIIVYLIDHCKGFWSPPNC